MPRKKRATAKKIPNLRIRRLTGYWDFKKLPDIQRRVWRHDETDLTPTHQFCISSIMGAIILGALINEDMVGFVFSFPAVHDNKLSQHSHLLAVLPDCQGYGIGKRLKWAQRDWALKLGYDRITWTVDPLQARNANLNIHTLGAVTSTYLRNFYGLDSKLSLGPAIPTDRFLMDWPIRKKRVGERRRGRFESFETAALPRALERKAGETDPLPGKPRLGLTDPLILAEVPGTINAWRGSHEPIASWQNALRRVFEHYFSPATAISTSLRIEPFVDGFDQLLHLERLFKKPLNLVALDPFHGIVRGKGGNGQDRDARGAPRELQTLQNRFPSAGREHDIQDDQAGVLLVGAVRRLEAVMGDHHFETRGAEIDLEKFQNVPIIVHDKNFLRHIRLPPFQRYHKSKPASFPRF
jgi:predicted GNAT superfamily acetyltransferase